MTGAARCPPEPTPLPSPSPLPHGRTAAKKSEKKRRPFVLLGPVGLCRAKPQSEAAAAQPVLFPYRGSQPHSCCRLLLLPPTFFFFFSSSSPPRRLLTPPRRAPLPPPRRMMPSHRGIGGSCTTTPLPPRPPRLLLLPPPRAPNGRASLVRAPWARRAGTCRGAAAAAGAGGPGRHRAVRSGGGREKQSLNRGSSKGTGLVPSACPGLNQLGAAAGRRGARSGSTSRKAGEEGPGSSGGAPSAGQGVRGQDNEGFCEALPTRESWSAAEAPTASTPRWCASDKGASACPYLGGGMAAGERQFRAAQAGGGGADQAQGWRRQPGRLTAVPLPFDRSGTWNTFPGTGRGLVVVRRR